jgi:thiol-disulfide isomerase/thioredoxin
MVDYTQKYLKYKTKYLKLKQKIEQRKQYGGNNKPEIILVKAEWCGHCKNFKNTWANLQKTPELLKKVNFTTLDADLNSKEVSQLKVSGYPTILIKKGTQYTEYNESREFENLKNYINKI